MYDHYSLITIDYYLLESLYKNTTLRTLVGVLHEVNQI